MPFTRRRTQKRKTAYGKRKTMAKRRAYRKKRTMGGGYMKLVRKLPEIYVRNTNVAGVAQVNDPTTTCVSLGTPILDAVGNTYSVPFSIKFALNQVINSTDITNLADQYRIKRAYIRVMYQSSQSNVGSGTIMPNLQWVTDVDDAVVPASINEVREKMGCRFLSFGFNTIRKISVVPKLQDTLANVGGVVANAAPKAYQWVNSSFPGVEHYAIKGILSNMTLVTLATALTSFKFDIALSLEARNFQ